MARSREKSLFLHREKDVWDCLAEEMQLREGLADQLATTRQEVAELIPTSRESADLQIRKADAREHACEAEEKLVALIERARANATESERL
jgi:hypothetical protein